MTGRRWLQVALVGLGLAVGLAVFLSWSEGTGRRTDEEAGLEAPEDSGTLVSRSENLRLRKADRSGAQRYDVQADTLSSYRSGRREWEGNVRMMLYSAPEGEEMLQEVTELTAGRLVERGPPDEPDQIQLQEDVMIRLPGGARIATERVLYRAADEQVATNAGVELVYAGLLFRARNLRYDRVEGRLELWNDTPGPRPDRVAIEAVPREDGGPAPRIVGGARRLVIVGDEGVVRLEGLPDIELEGAAVAGNVLILETAQERLESLRAEGEGAAVWSLSGGEHVLRAGIVDVELVDGEPSVVRGCRASPRPAAATFGPNRPVASTSATGGAMADPTAPRLASGDAGDAPAGSTMTCGDEGSGRPSLALAGGGGLDADRIDLFAGPGGAGAVVAGGGVSLDGRNASLGVDRLDAGSLRLELGTAGIEGAEASGGVELAVEDPDTPARFGGERLTMAWDGETLTRGTWPEGVEADLAGACAVAGRGEYLAEEGAWSLTEAPPPALRCEEAAAARPLLADEHYSVVADELEMGLDGRLVAAGDLEVTLRGESMATVAAVFGTGTEVEGSAGLLTVEDGRLVLEEDVRLWQGRQLMQVGETTLDPDEGTMSARGGVDVVLVRDDRTVDLSGERMLVERDPTVLRLTGDALLADGDRRMSGSTMVMTLGDSGFERVEMRGGISMQDPDGSSEGQELVWDFETGAVTVLGGPGRPATFRSPQGVQNQDPEGLEFRWDEVGLTIRALQKGTVQTLRSRRGGPRDGSPRHL